jgi:hypothetical protein
MTTYRGRQETPNSVSDEQREERRHAAAGAPDSSARTGSRRRAWSMAAALAKRQALSVHMYSGGLSHWRSRRVTGALASHDKAVQGGPNSRSRHAGWETRATAKPDDVMTAVGGSESVVHLDSVVCYRIPSRGATEPGVSHDHARELSQGGDRCQYCSASGSGSVSNVVGARSMSVVYISSRTGAPPSVCIRNTTRQAAAAQIAYCQLVRRQRGGLERGRKREQGTADSQPDDGAERRFKLMV